jgi:hypothetical protein
MMNDYVAAALAADRTRRLIAEADARRLAKLARPSERRAGGLMAGLVRWLRAGRRTREAQRWSVATGADPALEPDVT